MGMTGMEGVPIIITRFIGITVILGAIGILLPLIINVYPFLVPSSAICFALIMIPAVFIHYQRKEYKTVVFNFFVFIVCVVVIVGRLN